MPLNVNYLHKMFRAIKLLLATLIGFTIGTVSVNAIMIDNAKTAISVFKDRWQTEMFWSLNQQEQLRFKNFISQAIISAKKINCSSAAPPSETILYGKLSTLSRHGKCWQVTAALGFTTVQGYIATDSGDLLVVLDIPEG